MAVLWELQHSCLPITAPDLTVRSGDAIEMWLIMLLRDSQYPGLQGSYRADLYRQSMRGHSRCSSIS